MDLLWDITGAVAGGQDPLALPELAGTGYRADEPFAVRLTRLALPRARLRSVSWWWRGCGRRSRRRRRADVTGAALMLRQAAGWYLARFPGDAEALEMMLGLVGVPGTVAAVRCAGRTARAMGGGRRPLRNGV